MQKLASTLATALLIAFATACQQADSASEAAPGSRSSDTRSPDSGATDNSPPVPIAARSGGQPAFGAIRADETIRLVGTEPFWGGTIAGGTLTYSTLENETGEAIAVRRFAGNSGLGFSGTHTSGAVDIAITPGTCSDGMSDRTFPFTATLKIGDEQRSGCAWTDRQPFVGAEQP